MKLSTLIVAATTSALLLSGSAMAVRFAGCISGSDHFNSSGMRLYSANQVLQQFLAHRYNFSSYGGAYFANKGNRNRVGRSVVRPRHVRRAIVYGRPCFVANYRGGVTHVRLR